MLIENVKFVGVKILLLITTIKERNWRGFEGIWKQEERVPNREERENNLFLTT